MHSGVPANNERLERPHVPPAPYASFPIRISSGTFLCLDVYLRMRYSLIPPLLAGRLRFNKPIGPDCRHCRKPICILTLLRLCALVEEAYTCVCPVPIGILYNEESVLRTAACSYTHSLTRSPCLSRPLFLCLTHAHDNTTASRMRNHVHRHHKHRLNGQVRGI